MTDIFAEAQDFLTRVSNEIQEKMNNYIALPRVEFYADGSGKITFRSEEGRFTWLEFGNSNDLLEIVRGNPTIPWDNLPDYSRKNY